MLLLNGNLLVSQTNVCVLASNLFSFNWEEVNTYLRWDTLIISMGGSSFPRSPLNAKHRPKTPRQKERRKTDNEIKSVLKRSYWGNNKQCFLIYLKQLIHLIFLMKQLFLLFFSFWSCNGNECNLICNLLWFFIRFGSFSSTKVRIIESIKMAFSTKQERHLGGCYYISWFDSAKDNLESSLFKC